MNLIKRLMGTDLDGRPLFYTYGDGCFRLFSFIQGQFVFWGQKRETGRRGPQNASIRVSLYGGDSNLSFSFHIGLIFATLYLTFEDVMPKRFQPTYESKYGTEKIKIGTGRAFTFYYHERAFWLQFWDNEDDLYAKRAWINKMHVWNLPWDYEWVRTSMFLKNGMWLHETADNRRSWKFSKETEEMLWKETHPYRYALNSGEEQNLEATIGVEEREWRWRSRLFKAIGWPKKISKTISVDFSVEVGEGRGSWKGGTVGCGYEMLPNETPAECLKRMERERRFDR